MPLLIAFTYATVTVEDIQKLIDCEKGKILVQRILAPKWGQANYLSWFVFLTIFFKRGWRRGLEIRSLRFSQFRQDRLVDVQTGFIKGKIIKGWTIMARIPRMIITGEPAAYHIMSRTALDGFVMKDVEKDYLVGLIRHFSAVYFVDVLGFCVMGNHFHLLVLMYPEDHYDDDEITRRFCRYYSNAEVGHLSEDRIQFFRRKWSNLSEYVREIKQTFSRFYNKRHDRKGFFWGERFKSVIVDNGDTLMNCLAYIDLNPIRAGICKVPEAYRWCSLGYRVQSGNKNDFLSTDFGLEAFGSYDDKECLNRYRRFVYEKGLITHQREEKAGGKWPASTTGKDGKGLALGITNRLSYRTRYFTSLEPRILYGVATRDLRIIFPAVVKNIPYLYQVLMESMH